MRSLTASFGKRHHEGEYFIDTDTLDLKLNDRVAAETTELNDNVYVDIDQHGKVVGLTIEHTMEGSGKLDFSYETSAA